MENKIDKIITLDDGSKYMIMDQGNYGGKSYFLTSKLDSNENLTEKIQIFEETIESGEKKVSTVIEEKTLKALANYFNQRINV